jgi:hypothetical protein
LIAPFGVESFAKLELPSASARSHLGHGFVPRLPVGFAEEDLATNKSLVRVMVFCTTFISSDASANTSACRFDLSTARLDSHVYLEAATIAQE